MIIDYIEKSRTSTNCPDCGSRMIPESGCFYCRICGFSNCTLFSEPDAYAKITG